MGFVIWSLGPNMFRVAGELQGKMQISLAIKAETLQEEAKSEEHLTQSGGSRQA